jgi:hypothetical protein
MATTWQTITVRIERPAEVSLGEFFAAMRSWLDHHCIILADFRMVTLVDKSGVFDALFDNPRDARLFGCRFGPQPASGVPELVKSRWRVSAIASSSGRDRFSIPAAIAGVRRGALGMRPKLHQSA